MMTLRTILDTSAAYKCLGQEHQVGGTHKPRASGPLMGTWNRLCCWLQAQQQHWIPQTSLSRLGAQWLVYEVEVPALLEHCVRQTQPFIHKAYITTPVNDLRLLPAVSTGEICTVGNHHLELKFLLLMFTPRIQWTSDHVG